ncbi:uncharacterized protein TRIADDRAFT_28926 [Trichoplax adhaerens]|uniref:Myotubularin phosphatase domain-containing protein n=1 Tax=Trichoplax adhaerens TaxID=10228 RepID=B3S431_TRIAD|nr:hypothetical protein TRIADDRAFT_28926 [Trichoplax adhaerens]EDV22388.1 hypothetical protein TRIADDRAFT_28926 [Trichoplax adhaerens]|eukprot:XP_002114932.1 hypothetical protein TRIADDRAFT_28926 [Trichoplax adhaerens]
MEFMDIIKTPQVENVTFTMVGERKSVSGTLCLTSHQLIFFDKENKKDELWIFISSIDSLEKKITDSSLVVNIRCKNFRNIQLTIGDITKASDAFESIEKLVKINEIDKHHAFYYNPNFAITEDGWKSFNLETEYARLTAGSRDFRVLEVNKGFKICSSYPERCLVPSSVNENIICKSAKFRYLGRFPIVSYIYHAKKAVLMRSSQPLSGPNELRCKEDEKLLNAAIFGPKHCYIVDTRLTNYATNIKNKGGGVEPSCYYPQWHRIHRGIENYNSLKDSLTKLVEATSDFDCSSSAWLSRVSSSNWLNHVRSILNTACFVIGYLFDEGATVLVHGSDGMDATLQITSLAQIMIDQDCRTIRGFQALIEREWLLGGHPFSSRCSKLCNTQDISTSPVFLLFLDCVWQLQQQHPCFFEFNEEFLRVLGHKAYSSEFGTFLYDSHAQRLQAQLPKRTCSLWSYINQATVINDYINPSYEMRKQIIRPSTVPHCIVCMKIYLCHYNVYEWSSHG